MTRPEATLLYDFGGFRLDPRRRLLSGADGELISLKPKVFDTLLYLVEHAGELVDKRALMQAIWGNVVVEENNLNKHISTLRHVLGEIPGENRFLVTVSGRGYRFVAAVREGSAEQIGRALDTPAVTPQSNPEATSEIDAKGRGAPFEQPSPKRWQLRRDSIDAVVRAPNAFNRRWPFAVAALMGFALIFLGIERYVSKDDAADDVVTNETVETPSVVDPARPTNSIAVLPFVNLSSDPEQEYFSDGLSEELLSNLAQHTDLRVTARSSSFAFKGSDRSIQEIARALGVAHVLEGSVRRAGNRLRITAQLIDAADGYNLWSDTYNRELGDVFALQQEISAIVAESLSATLGVARRGPGLGGTEVFDAYDLSLVARAHCYRLTRDDNTRCLDYIDQAIALDPGFASAWAAKSAAHVVANRLFPERSAAEQDAAVRAALHAIELEPNLGLAHAALGDALSQQPGLLQAEEEYRKAIALGLRMGEISSYAVLQFAVGNIDKAREILQARRATDPLNPTIVAFLTATHHIVGDTPQALAEDERGRAAYSNWTFGNFVAAVVRLSSGEVTSPTELPLEGGDIDEAATEHFYVPERALQELRILYADERHADQIARRRLAVWAAYFGDPELALRAMKDSATVSTLNAFLLWFPLFSEVRQQPGFKDLMRELGIVAHWRAYGWPRYCQPSGGDDFECS